MSKKTKTELKQVFSSSFLTEIEKARFKSMDILMNCLKPEYAFEIRRFCESTQYQIVNAVATTIYPISFLNSLRTVKGYSPEERKEEASESGCMSLMVVGNTGSGKTSFLAKRIHTIMMHEADLRKSNKIQVKRANMRLQHLYKKQAELQITPEEEDEIIQKEKFLKEHAPFFYGYTTPEKMLKAIGDAEMAAIIEDEGESLVQNIFSRKNSNGLNFGSIINRLLDGTPTRYDTKSDPAGDDLAGFSFSIYCNVQPDYFKKMDTDGDITNKLGRFNMLLVTEEEKKGIAMMARSVMPDISMPKIDELIRSIYIDRKAKGLKGGEIKVNILPFLRVFRANLDFWSQIAKPRTPAQRIFDLILKHRKRWADYARGLEPLCKNEEALSTAIATFLLLMILNIVQHYVADNISRDATNIGLTVDNFLKEAGVYDLIQTALKNKREGVGDGILSTYYIQRDFRKETNASSKWALHNLIKELQDKGIIKKVAWGKYEVLDYQDNIPQLGLLKFDFGCETLGKT